MILKSPLHKLPLRQGAYSGSSLNRIPSQVNHLHTCDLSKLQSHGIERYTVDTFSGHHLGDQTRGWKRSLEEERSIEKLNKVILENITGLWGKGYTPRDTYQGW